MRATDPSELYIDHSFTINVLKDSNDVVIDATPGDDILGPVGEWYEQDVVLSGLNQSYVLTGGLGNDVLGGGSHDDILDGGDGSLDIITYHDAPSGINANLITGVVQDGYGSVDQISNFERFYGSYYNDVVTLSDELIRGYFPAYGNDIIIGLDTLADGRGAPPIAYYNLHDDDDVTDTYIIFNYDQGTVDKTIIGGEFAGSYQDTFTGYVTIVGSA